MPESFDLSYRRSLQQVNTVMKYVLLLVAAIATASAQVPAYIYGTTSQILDVPSPIFNQIPEEVDSPQNEASFGPQSSLAESDPSPRSPLIYPDNYEGGENQVPYLEEPGFNSPNDQVNLYASSGEGTVQKNAIAPPAFVEGQVPLAVSPVLSQYRTQYVDGRYDFGYAGGPNSRTETRDASGKVRGAYIYVDAFGNVQSRRYEADDQGFRAEGTDIPKATFALEDTPEVKEAKEALRKAYDQARTRVGRSTQPWLYNRAH